MNLTEILHENRDLIDERWRDAIFRTYPLDTVGFMRRQKDQFANPVGQRTTAAISALVDLLIGEGLDSEAVRPHIDEIVRVRAIQDFSASQAVGVIFLLKTVVRELVRQSEEGASLYGELLQFESKIDSLALLSFENYCICRDQINQLRIDEVKRQHSRLLERAKMIYGDQAEDPDTPKH